jgi:ABC-2 type transport system permease protein
LFFSTWWLIMERYDNVRGWRLPDMACLYGIAAAGFGSSVVLAGGLRDLAGKIYEGELDALLTQPKSVLLSALASRTNPSGWGDVATGAILIGASGRASLATLPLLAVGVAAACLTFVACAVVMHSLAFWWGRTESLSRSLWEFTLTFSLYPPALFGPGLKVVLFTLLPAGFASYLPVQLIRSPSPEAVLACVFGSLAYAAAAVLVFARGLRHYESGNRFTLQG